MNDAQQTMRQKFEAALSELIGMCEDGGMTPDEFIPALERELAWARDPAKTERLEIVKIS